MTPQRSRSPLIVAVAGAISAALGCWAVGCSSPAARQPGGMLLITLDTVRADRIGAYGYADIETPFIDGLARRDVGRRAAAVQHGQRPGPHDH